MSRYGFCLEKSMKYKILDEIGNHFLDKVVEQVNAGKKFTLVLDNIDWTVNVHDMLSDNQNTSVHAVAATMVFNRVSSDHLPDEHPQGSLATCDIVKLVGLTDDELNVIRQHYMNLLAQVILEFLPAFSFLKDVIPIVPSKYEKEMCQKSLVVPLPVLMKDEKKYADIVDVVDQLETWLHEAYSCEPADDTSNDPPTLRPTSKPDQPSSHVPPVADDSDPLASVKVPCFGDQLTRVRFAGARDLRAGNKSARDRLDHIYPLRIADWHTKRSFLKVY